MSHELGPLPEPFAFCYVWKTEGGRHLSFSANHWNGRPCDDQAVLLTNEQTHAYAQAQVARAVARERERCATALRIAREGYASEALTGLPVLPQWRERAVALIDEALKVDAPTSAKP